MANTYVDYTAVASQTDYNFSFEYLRDDHVKVKVNGTLVTNYTIVTSPTPTKIRFNTAPAAGAAIKIYRDSRGDFSPLVDFVDGSVLTENELDEAYKHNLFVSQESSEGTGGEQLTKKGLTDYDAEGNKIINLGTPTASTDAANKAYTDQTIDNAIALGGSPAIVSLGGYGVTTLGSTRARSLAERFGDVVNVLDHGADNTGTVETSSHIQAAINEANTGGKGVVYFPAGTYLVNTELNCAVGFPGSGLTLLGADGFQSIISCSSNIVVFRHVERFTVKRLRINQTGGISVNAGSFSIGKNYTITATGTTDFTLIGASNSNPGTTFKATGVGTGTGTADSLGTIGAAFATPDYRVTTHSLFEDLEVHGFKFGLLWRYSTHNAVRNVRMYNVACGVRLARHADTITNIGDQTNPIAAGAWNQPAQNGWYHNQNTFDTMLFQFGEVGIWGSPHGNTFINITAQIQDQDGTSNVALPVGQEGTGFFLEGGGFNTVTAGSFLIGNRYIIKTVGTTDFTLIGAGSAVSAGSFIVGDTYTILTAGTTDFTLIGADDSNPGTVFTATGVGTGTGTAGEFGVGTAFTATGVGTGTGTAEHITSTRNGWQNSLINCYTEYTKQPIVIRDLRGLTIDGFFAQGGTLSNKFTNFIDAENSTLHLANCTGLEYFTNCLKATNCRVDSRTSLPEAGGVLYLRDSTFVSDRSPTSGDTDMNSGSYFNPYGVNPGLQSNIEFSFANGTTAGGQTLTLIEAMERECHYTVHVLTVRDNINPVRTAKFDVYNYGVYGSTLFNTIRADSTNDPAISVAVASNNTTLEFTITDAGNVAWNGAIQVVNTRRLGSYPFIEDLNSNPGQDPGV